MICFQLYKSKRTKKFVVIYRTSKTKTYRKFLKLSPPSNKLIAFAIVNTFGNNWSISSLSSQLSRLQDLLYFRTRTSQTVVARDDRPHNLHRCETFEKFENLLHFHSNKHILQGLSIFERSMIGVSLKINYL